MPLEQSQYEPLTITGLKEEIAKRGISLPPSVTLKADLVEILDQNDEDLKLEKAIIEGATDDEGHQNDGKMLTPGVLPEKPLAGAERDWEDDYFFKYIYENNLHHDPTKRKYEVSGKPSWFDHDAGQEIGEGFAPDFKEFFDKIIPAKYGVKYYANPMSPSPAGIAVTVLIPLKHSFRDFEYLREMRCQRHVFFIGNLSTLTDSDKKMSTSKLNIFNKFIKKDL